MAQGRFRTDPEKVKNTYKRLFTVEDSIKSTLLTLKEGNIFKEEVLKFAKEKKKQKMHFHPIMGVFLNSQGSPSVFVLYINNIIMNFNAFPELLKMYLRCFFLFNLEYPSEGRLSCRFLAATLFGFEEVDSPGWTRVRSLCSEFDSFKKNLTNI